MIDFLVTAIIFLVIFSILVLIHEFGHFYTAIKSGIKVEEFGFGLPPRLWGVKKKGILWSINWIPFGGFVRMLGEDATDSKALKDKRSFAAQPARTRILVVTAGVIMNLLLAVVLLTFGFIFGIQPLILSADEVLEHLDKGNIKTANGILVETVEEDSPAFDAGMKVDDKILEIDGQEILSADQIASIISDTKQRTLLVTVERGNAKENLNIVVDEGEEVGFKNYELIFLPRVIVKDIKEESASTGAGLLKGDVILKINDKSVYFVDEYEAALRGASVLNYEILRNDEVKRIKVDLSQQNLVVISSVFPGTPAQEAGVQKGDVIVAVNNVSVSLPEDVVEVSGEFPEQAIQYKVERNGEFEVLTVSPDEQGLIGVGLSVIKSYENEELSVYASDFPVSVLKIEDVSYPVWEAPIKAVEESYRLGVMTVGMAGNVFKSVFTQFTVPEGVAGPVGIAQLTHVFVQEGFLSIIRFVALLSLSLAIINILPFPALDGGRLLFIVAELIVGRRVSAKFEAWIHAIGFIILMLIVLFVTYSDILRFF